MKADLLRAGLIAASVLLAFLPVLSNQWVSWDDPEALFENPALREEGLLGWALTTERMSHFQPLSWLVWAAIGRLFDFRAEAFHASSLLVHFVNAGLLYLLLRELGLVRDPSAIAALAFAVHPLRVEPVAWASAFPYLLSTTFLLVSARAYARRSPVVSALLYAGSIFARPIAFAFPLVLVALDRVRDGRWRVVPDKVPFFAIAIAGLFLELRARAFLDLGDYGVGARLTLAAESFLSQSIRLVWPVGLTPLDPLPLEPAVDARALALGSLVLVGSGALAFALRSRFRAAPALWISWLLLLFPSLGLAPSGLQATADRYSYVPSLVLAVSLGGALTRLPRAVSGASLLGVAVLGIASYRQSSFWKDSVTLWGRAVELDPGNDLALYFHASALTESGRFDEAAATYRRLLAIVPDHGPARKDLARVTVRQGDALAAAGDLADAIGRYQEALESDPQLDGIRERLGMALFQLGRSVEALSHLEAAFAQGFTAPAAANALALLLNGSGRGREAVAVLENAASRFPDDLAVLHNLARLLATGAAPGQEAEAVALAERVVARTEGGDPRALDTLALALASRGSLEEAKRTFERAILVARSMGDLDLAREIEAHARERAGR